MDILLPGPGRRVPGLDFDADGPKIGGAHLLAKSSHGFMPLPRDDLDDILRETIDGPFESKHMHQRLAAIARAFRRSMEARRDAGLNVLRRVGILYP